MAQENTSALLFDQDTDLVDVREIEQVTVDFSKLIDEMGNAIQQTKDATALASRVNAKGVFDTFCGGMTGKNDKELAESVKVLGGSVEITQKILEVILKINHTKNKYLKSFHSALTDKILSLSKEMDVTYGNQKNAKQATIIIATELKAQIEEKIKHAEMIDEHEEEISQLQEFAQSKEILDGEQSKQINELKEKVKYKDKLDDQQSIDIINLNKIVSRLNLINETQSHEINILKDKDIQNENQFKKHCQEIKVLTYNTEILQNSVDLTTDNFNKYVTQRNSFSCQLKGLLLPIMSLLIASAAIYFSLR